MTEDSEIEEENLPPSLENIMSLIQRLPNQYRLIFNLYEIDDYTHKEIATMLHISESTSKSNLHRAKQILKKEIFKSKAMKHKKRLGRIDQESVGRGLY